MGLNLDASPEELKIFLEEVEEHFQTLEDDLLRLEKEGEFNEDLLQEIFRAAHTLKGSSATIGHNRMAQLTHGMENILDKLRKRQLTVTSHLIDIMFECLDCLRVLRDEIINDEESDIDLEDIMEKLASLTEGEEADSSKKPAVVPEAENKISIDLSWEEKDHLHQAIEQGLNPFLIQISFDVEPEMLAVRTFVTLRAVEEMGEVIKSRPTDEEIEKEQVTDTLVMLMVTRENKEAVERMIKDFPSVASYNIQPFSDDILDVGGNDAVKDEVKDDGAEKADDKREESAKGAGGGKGGAGQGRKTVAKKANRTVRVDVDLLDNLMNLVGELVIDRTRLFQILGILETNYEKMDDISDDLGRTSVHIARVTTQLQEQIMKARMLPVESLFNKFPRMVRDLAQKAGKEIDFIMTGQETELDRSIIEEIGDPLIHLLRNAVDHGIETPEERRAAGKPTTGVLKLQASHEENHIIITIKDDGRGIDPEKVKQSGVQKGIVTEEQVKRLTDKEAINLIFMSGLSTATKISDVSGRGVGMDVVRNNIEKINGAIEINSVVGEGTEFRIKLPLTLAIIRALLVQIGKSVYAIPLSTVTETIRLTKDQIEFVNNKEVFVLRGKVLPLIRLAHVFARGSGEQKEQDKLFVVVVNVAGQQVGVVVDSLVGEQEIVIKSLGKYIGDVQGISGATILGDGNVALIVDVSNLVKKAAS